MNEEKLNRLLRAARGARAPEPPGDFEVRTMRAVARETHSRPASLFEQLSEWFPRVSWAAAAVVVLCVATDSSLSLLARTDLALGVSEITEQWLFAVK